MLAALEKIEGEHKTFDQHAEELIHLLDEGEISEALALADKVEAVEEELDHELEALSEQIPGP